MKDKTLSIQIGRKDDIEFCSKCYISMYQEGVFPAEEIKMANLEKGSYLKFATMINTGRSVDIAGEHMSLIYILKVGDKRAGFLVANSFAGGVIEINLVYIIKKHRNNGYLDFLVKEFLRQAKELSKQIGLIPTFSIKIPIEANILLYASVKKLGFELVGKGDENFIVFIFPEDDEGAAKTNMLNVLPKEINFQSFTKAEALEIIESIKG